MICRHPSRRPSNLKQADDKLVAGIFDFYISPAIAKGTTDIQIVLIHGRLLIQNAADPNFHSRMQASDLFACRKYLKMMQNACIGMADILPFLILLDFAFEFPSVAHAWLFLCA